jgi:hypothetical protein
MLSARTTVRRADERPDHTRRGLFVLGMHRSGTSALARWLSFLGAALPRNLMGSSPHNPSGHWESLDLFRIHDALLAAGNTSWHDCMAVPEAFFTSPEIAEHAKRLSEVIVRDFPDDPLFVVKDPRICRLVPLWRRIMADLRIEFVPVISLRNPLEVVESLRRRDELPTAKAYLLWLRHVLDAESATRDQRRVVLEYTSLLADWRKAIRELSRRLELSFAEPSPEACKSIDSFLSPAQRHHVFDSDDLAARREIADWVTRTYSAMLSIARGRGGARAHATLDRVRAEFNTACRAFAPLLDEETAGRRRLLVEVEVSRQAVQAQIAERDAARVEVARLGAELSAERAARTAELARLAADVSAQRDAARLEIARLGEDLSVRSERLAALSSALVNQVARVVKLESAGGLGQRRRSALRVRWPRRGRPYRARVYRALAQSGLFDAAYYLAWNADVRLSAIDALDHYLTWGEKEGRKPHPLFDPTWYLTRHPDVAEVGMSALYHYVVAGNGEGLFPNPWFDSAWYLKQADLVADTLALLHYATRGYKEGRWPCPAFDPVWYKTQHAALADPDVDPLAFHIEIGAWLGLPINPGLAERES